MILQPKDTKNLLLTGLFITFLIIVTSISIMMISKEQKIFGEKITLETIVHNAQNIKVGSVVQLKGIKAGKVTQVDFLNINTIKVTFEVDKEFQKWIKKDSHVAFKTQGVLGDRYLEILGGTPTSEPVSADALIEADEASQIDQFMSQGEGILMTSTRVLNKIDTLLGTLEKGRVGKILESLEKSTYKTQQLLKGINNKKFAKGVNRLSDVSLSAEKLLKRVEKGPGNAHSLIYDNSAYEDLRKLLGGAQRNKVLKYFIRESIKDSN